MLLSLVTSAGKVVTAIFCFPFLWTRKIQEAALLRARIGIEIIYSSLAFLVDMTGIGRNCAVSVFR